MRFVGDSPERAYAFGVFVRLGFKKKRTSLATLVFYPII